MTTATPSGLTASSPSPTAATEPALPERVRTTSLALAALALGHLAVDSCTGIWPVFKTLAGLDLAQAGMIATTGGVLGNALQLAFGRLADSGHRRKLLVAGVLAASAALWVGLTRSFWVHAALILLTSIGSAAFHPSGAGAAGRLTQSRQGLMVAGFLAGGYIGFAFSQLAFTAAYRLAPVAPLLLALLPVTAAGALFFLISPASEEPRHGAGAAPILWSRLLPLLTVQLLTTALGLSLIFLLPDLMMARGAPAVLVAGGGHAVYVLGGALSLLPGGILADRLGTRTLLLAVNTASIVLLAALLGTPPSPAVSLVLVALFGFFNGVNNVTIVAEGNRIMPTRASAASSLLMGLPWCIAALAPSLAGALAEPSHGGTPDRALSWMALSLPVTLLVSTTLPKRGAAR